jgi:hypothetical protein
MPTNYVVMSDGEDNSLFNVVEFAEQLSLNVTSAIVVDVDDLDLEPALQRLINARGLTYLRHSSQPVEESVLENASEDLRQIGYWVHPMCRCAVEPIQQPAEEPKAKFIMPVRHHPCSICGSPISGRRKICDRSECRRIKKNEYQEHWRSKGGVATRSQVRAGPHLPCYEVISGSHKGSKLTTEKLESFLKIGRFEVGTFINKAQGQNQGEYQVVKNDLVPVEVE